MRDPYAGDISDMLKFALLRALAGDDRTIGVGWYYNPSHDSRVDGGHRIDCDGSRWKPLDSTLFDALKKLPERSVKALETLPIWPLKTLFHRIPVPPRENRPSWAVEMGRLLQETDIVFLDPDNGLGSISEKRMTLDEVKLMRKPGRTVVLIKFPSRYNHNNQLEAYHGLLAEIDGVSMVTIRTCVCVSILNKRGRVQWIPRVRWFTILDAEDVLIERARMFVDRLNLIERCTARVQEATIKVADNSIAVLNEQCEREGQMTRLPVVDNVCPECGHQFKGNGFGGIDAHWRAKHEGIMLYKDAWPLIKTGNYGR